MKNRLLVLLFLFCSIPASLLFSAESASQRYALILSDPPLATRLGSRLEAQSSLANDYRGRIQAGQQNLRGVLAARRIPIVGSVEYLANAIFVQASPDRKAELQSLPGVMAVIPLRRYKLKLNRAVQLVNAPAAWNTLGGVQNAGLGIKIGMLDTGIDQTHPAFQDSSLTPPPGYPICNGADCAFTNNKVIVARSYVRQLAAGSDPANPALDSRPDDYSPRDRTGHGTATASVAAGETNNGPAATITGMAPRAFLGNYKIFGSDQVNGYTDDAIIILAMEDALKDGMDIVSLSLGAPAFSGPLDTGSVCGNPPGVACDMQALVIENAVKSGMTVVTAAGNEGSTGLKSNTIPTLNTIDTPGDTPSAIAVGASTNSHYFTNSVTVPGSDVPPALQQLAALFGDGPFPLLPVTGPMRDVARLQNDGFACSALPSGSLNGSLALIQRGSCPFLMKVNNAQSAGAIGVIFYLNDQESLFNPSGLANTNIPAALISNSDGLALKSFSDSNPDHPGTLDTVSLAEVIDTADQNFLASFSSLGPSTGDSNIKPDLVAVGTQMYMATEKYDPDGALYSPDGYVAGDGTSFATPMVAGAAALVKQKNPRFTALQIKSALVTTATNDVTGNSNGPGKVNEVGGGKLDTNAAVNATVTCNPATLSFGVISPANSLPITKTIQIINSGSSTANLTISIAPTVTDSRASLKLDKSSLSLSPGASGSLSVTLSGNTPVAGSYEGKILMQGGTVSLHVPYLYMVGDGTPTDLIPLTGIDFDGTVNGTIPDGLVSFKLIDDWGLPISGANVTFRFTHGGGTIQNADSKTDRYGIATAVPVLGPTPCSQLGCQEITGSAGGLTFAFDGTARLMPTIPSNGIVNAASFEAGKPVAPGSYISIFGSGLSDDTNFASSLPLPLAVDYVSVSFDVASAGLSLPGRPLFVSPGQVNLQIPWELQGQSSVQVKVSVDFTAGNVYTLPLAPYSPAFFEYKDSGSGNNIAAALDENNKLVGSGNPVLRGHVVQLYANGLGAVSNQPNTGEPASASALAQTNLTPSVTIGGQTATVTFSGLAPGFPALYQVNVNVPANVGTGVQPIVIAIGGVTSKTSNLPIQ